MAVEEARIDVESIPDAVVVVDARGCITQMNAHADALFGYEHGELRGQRIETLVPRIDAGKNLSARHRSGRDVPVEILLSPGAADTVVAVVRDVSHGRELERFRDEYLGYISHDLKNPLSVIALQARLLARRLAGRPQLEEEVRSVEIIAQSAAFIDRLVRDLLEMSYLEVQDVQLHKKPVELGRFLATVLERTVSTADRERIRLEIRDETIASIDATRVERVVANFVQNALKYAPPDSPILVRLEVRDRVAVVSVVDQGPGLTPEEAAYVFDKYRRAAAAEKREGLGLGLYISQKIIEAHDGRIGVDATSGKGSRFFFELPVAEAGAAARAARDAPQPNVEGALRRLRGAHVLLVDDEAAAVSALGELLRDEAIVVSTATSGAQALASIETDPPDVAVLDVEMPGMSGIELLRRLRERLPGLPAVFMTGYMSRHAGITEARAATGAAYVSKPVDVDELFRTLGRIFVTRRR